jgi:hypothetical protein
MDDSCSSPLSKKSRHKDVDDLGDSESVVNLLTPTKFKRNDSSSEASNTDVLRYV